MREWGTATSAGKSGQDISPSITPVEAGMSWAIGWDKPTFGGREALVRQRESGP